MSERPLRIVCPLEFERRALRRAGLGRRFEIDCCGPGAEAVRSWVRTRATRGDVIILVGVGGGLRDPLAGGSAHWIDETIEANGPRRRSPVRVGRSSREIDRPITALSVDRVLATTDAKRDAAARWDADVVDLESAAFAGTAEEIGASWGVVRGISDDARTPIPPGIAAWTNARGRTRIGRVIADALFHPWIAPDIVRIARNARRAMRAAASLLESIGDDLPPACCKDASHPDRATTDEKQPSP